MIRSVTDDASTECLRNVIFLLRIDADAYVDFITFNYRWNFKFRCLILQLFSVLSDYLHVPSSIHFSLRLNFPFPYTFSLFVLLFYLPCISHRHVLFFHCLIPLVGLSTSCNSFPFFWIFTSAFLLSLLLLLYLSFNLLSRGFLKFYHKHTLNRWSGADY
jgi:hypothetical protein